MSAPRIVHIQVSWLAGYDTPVVEMWTETENSGCDGVPAYGYFRICQPYIPDEQEWLRLRGEAHTAAFVPREGA